MISSTFTHVRSRLRHSRRQAARQAHQFLKGTELEAMARTHWSSKLCGLVAVMQLAVLDSDFPASLGSYMVAAYPVESSDKNHGVQYGLLSFCGKKLP